LKFAFGINSPVPNRLTKPFEARRASLSRCLFRSRTMKQASVNLG